MHYDICMPARRLATQALAELLGVLSHPDRVRIVEELRQGELDVNHLCERLGLAHARMSQQLSLLRNARVVVDRREGRHVYYHLADPRLAAWLLDGLAFVETGADRAERVRSAIHEVRMLWSEPDKS